MRYTDGMRQWQHLYDGRWTRYSVAYLRQNPLCTFCASMGRIEAAAVVDHIQPHKGDVSLFWDTGNHQALCATCHNSAKAREESRGFSSAVGEDGWPTDSNHPVNRRR